MMDCKKALKETDGDMEAAIAYLRQKGLAVASKRAGRATSKGRSGPISPRTTSPVCCWK